MAGAVLPNEAAIGGTVADWAHWKRILDARGAVGMNRPTIVLSLATPDEQR
ncbi:hypothetical protein CP97_09825 [Aurantiacibacter atlanticus]|uniref:Uncharacterized protein n=1 Tax=Aurantiacibacter atlanticus TaxID=1648404 RepID=A0A0H4VD41_9SPHN|nr:hypothetical protein CP97_09825 [Aurantiacibacter atlanticus]